MEGRRTIAILGGGQLGRMFLENALRYNVHVIVLDPDPNAPCALLADHFAVGDLNDRDTVMNFAKDADVVGIEIEHVSVEALFELKQQGKQIIPDPEVLRTIKDKGLQKEFYVKHGIPTAPFALVSAPSEINEQHAHLLPAFLKTRSGGYDGKGVMPLNRLKDIDQAFACACVIEQRVEIELELAVLVVRDASGVQMVYDPVEMVFDPQYNLVDHLRAPARIPAALAQKAQDLASKVAMAFNASGIYAVELFLDHKGELLVNETAPRAHNSGHHTIEACGSSQFDQLLRLYMDWPLGNPTLQLPAAMINLVGSGGDGIPSLPGMTELLAQKNTFVHLYGKAHTRNGRKMGHVSVTATDPHDLDALISNTRKHCNVIPTTAPHE